MSRWSSGVVGAGHRGASSAADWDVLRWSELFEGTGQSEEGTRVRSDWQHWSSQGEEDRNAKNTPKNKTKDINPHFQPFVVIHFSGC